MRPSTTRSIRTAASTAAPGYFYQLLGGLYLDQVLSMIAFFFPLPAEADVARPSGLRPTPPPPRSFAGLTGE